MFWPHDPVHLFNGGLWEGSAFQVDSTWVGEALSADCEDDSRCGRTPQEPHHLTTRQVFRGITICSSPHLLVKHFWLIWVQQRKFVSDTECRHTIQPVLVFA